MDNKVFNQCTKCNRIMGDNNPYGLCLVCSNMGSTSELLAMAALSGAGYAVAEVKSDASPTDLVVSCQGKWLPLQVKTFYADRTRMIANTCKTTAKGRKAYTLREVAAFCLVHGPDVYVVPYAEISRMRTNLKDVQEWKVVDNMIPAFTRVVEASSPQLELPFPDQPLFHYIINTSGGFMEGGYLRLTTDWRQGVRYKADGRVCNLDTISPDIRAIYQDLLRDGLWTEVSRAEAMATIDKRYVINVKGFGGNLAYLIFDKDLNGFEAVERDGSSSMHEPSQLPDPDWAAFIAEGSWKEVSETEAKALLN